jgi:hypothetical protein
MELTEVNERNPITLKKGIFITYEEQDNIFCEILDRVIQGETINAMLTGEAMPNPAMFFKWLTENPTLGKQYAYAREVRSHALFDDLLIIANGDKANDSICQVQRDRLRADTIKFYISKILPKVYGEKIDVTSNGEAINIISLGTGIAPPSLDKPSIDTEYIDVS